MKKLILLLALAVTSLFATAQDSTKVEVKFKDTSNTFMKVYTDISGKLDALGTSLKVGSEKVYTVMIKQQRVESIVNVIIYLLAFLLLFIGINHMLAALADSRKQVSAFVGVVCLLLAAIGVIHLIATISDTVTGFINPEYGAINEIVNFLK